MDDAVPRSHAGAAARADFDAWLDGSPGADALRPATESALGEWPAARRVNDAGIGDDGPTIIERVDAACGRPGRASGRNSLLWRKATFDVTT